MALVRFVLDSIQ